jgi:hypothetical protein
VGIAGACTVGMRAVEQAASARLSAPSAANASRLARERRRVRAPCRDRQDGE